MVIVLNGILQVGYLKKKNAKCEVFKQTLNKWCEWSVRVCAAELERKFLELKHTNLLK